MNIFKASVLTGVSVSVKLTSMLALNKLLAIYIGPAGYAIIGQFQNAVQMVTTFLNGPVNVGVTKYTSEFSGDKISLSKLWSTAFYISVALSLFFSVSIIIFRDYVGEIIFHTDEYGGVLLFFSFSLIFFSFNTLLMAILVGQKNVRAYVSSNIVGSLITLALTSLLALSYGLYGALIAFATYQSFSFFSTFYIAVKSSSFKLLDLTFPFDYSIACRLFHYSFMALVGALSFPICQIYLREYIVANLGWNSAGYWEAMTRLSAAYLSLISTMLSVYYLPRMSSHDNLLAIRKEVVSGFIFFFPLAILISTAVYILRFPIIDILFTSGFVGMEPLFFWQVVGDTVKISGWLIAYIMLGQAMTKLFVITEIAFTITLYILTTVSVSYLGFEGVSFAYFINYCLYFIVVSVSVYIALRSKFTISA